MKQIVKSATRLALWAGILLSGSLSTLSVMMLVKILRINMERNAGFLLALLYSTKDVATLTLLMIVFAAGVVGLIACVGTMAYPREQEVKVNN